MPALLCILALMLVCACAPVDVVEEATSTAPAPTSAISALPTPINGHLLMRAEQTQAPALATSGDMLLVTWIGTDEQDIRHFAQWQLGTAWQAPQALPLLTNTPHQQRLVTTSNGIIYLLWLDALPDYPEAQRVWFAPIAPDYSITPGALPLSTIETLCYTALPDAEGGIWVIWGGGLLSEPTLYGQYIERTGRPRLPERLLDNADHPALIADAQGNQWFFWLSDNRLWRARWVNGALVAPVNIAPAIRLGRGELLEGFAVGIGGQDALAVWHITQNDGTPRTFWTVGRLDATSWDAPQAHSALWLSPNWAVDDGLYAVGVASSAPYDLRLYQWTGDGWWAKREGVPIASRLLSPPLLMRNTTLGMLLTWSQPQGNTADLWLWQGE